MHLNIKIQTRDALYLSTWNTNPPNLLAGEIAVITRCVVADDKNPLYEITKQDNTTFVCHRNQLVEVGALAKM